MNKDLPVPMNKDFPVAVGKIVTLSLTLMKCASENCNEQKNKAFTNEELIKKYNEYKLEQNKSKKIKLFAELNNNITMYELNKCAIKNCKKILKDIIKILKSIKTMIPQPTEKSVKLNKIIKNIETIINSPEITYEQYNKYVKIINDITKTLN
jgi:hypothetical protein